MNNLSQMLSSAFTVPSNAQTLAFDRTFVQGSSSITVKVAPGPTYSTFTQTYIESSGATQPWATKSFNITNWQGQSIKLRFEATGKPGIDNVAVMKNVHPSWSTWISGTAYSNVPELVGDGPSGNYSKLNNGEKLWTGAFTVPANGTTVAEIRRTYFDGSSGLNIYVLVAPDYTPPGTQKYLENSATSKPWEIKSSSVAGLFDLSMWAGQKIKLRIEATSGTNQWVGIDDVVMNFTSASSGSGTHASTPDPVDTTSGAFSHSHTDILIPGRGVPLEFTRSYSSMSMVNGVLGHRWTHNYAWSLRIESDGDGTVTYPSGATARFDWNSVTQTFTAPAGTFDTLVRTGGASPYTYTLTTKSQIRYEFTGATPVLTAIKDRSNNTTTLTYSGGLLTTVTDASGARSLTFSYDGSNRIFRITDPLPSPSTRTVEFTYDGNGDLWKVKDVKGDAATGPFTIYTYDSHRMSALTDTNGHVQVQNFYDDANRVVEQLDALNNRTCIYYGTAYGTTANCTGVTPAPAEGETVMVDPRSDNTTYSFDTTFRTSDVQDHNGGVVHYDFDSNSNITCVTDQRGKKTGYSYDWKGNVTQMVDALNTDASCQLKAGGVKWTYTYTSRNDVDLETDPLGRQTDYIYDTIGKLTRIVRKDSGGALKALTCFERDSLGQVTASVQSTSLVLPAGPTDPCMGNRTLFGYDTYGNQSCVVNPRFSGTTTCASDPGKKAAFIYDLGGRLLYSTDEITNNSKPVRGSAPETGSQCGTDGNGNGVNDDSADDSVVDDGCPSTKYTYDAQNNILTVADGLGNVTTNTYDAKGNLTSVKDANRKTAGATPESGSQCGTDGTGNGVNDDPGDDSVVDDGCLSVVYRYDNGDRLEKVIQAAVSSSSIPTTTYSYDGNGNRTSLTNAKRQPVGPSETITQGWCGTGGTGNDIDEDGDTVKDDGCPSTKYAYDNLDRLQSSTDALGRMTSHQYDAASNLTQRTDARNLVTKYFPDDMNRLDLVEHWNGMTLVDSVDYTYDEVSNRKTMVDPTGSTTYNYDALNRPSSIVFPGPKTVSYTYDDLPGGLAADYPGQRTKITYPDSKYVDYTYEPDGRMKTVTDWLTKQTAYTYDDAGRLTKTQYPNTVWTDYTYDTADGLTTVVNKKPGPITVSSFTYTLDAVGNRRQMVDLSGTHSYDYDALYRLSQVTYPGPQTDSHTYDANGNRLTKNATTYSYDAADQMTAAGGVTYGYDNNGNQTSRGSDAFTYDHENRLTKIVVPNTVVPEEPCYDLNGSGFVDTGDIAEINGQFGGTDAFYDLNGSGFVDTADIALVTNQFGKSCTSRFTYNGDGLRVARAGSHLNWKYIWDVASGLPVILKETDSHNAIDGHGTDNTYVYGLDLISVTDRTGAQSYFLYDGLGSTTELTDGSGSTAATYSYDVFGAMRSESGTGAFGNEWRFTGEQRDRQGSRQFYYLRARYYDPATGRFLSQDPLPTGNLYAYVANNPLRYVDPYGLDACSTVSGAVTSVFGGKKKNCDEVVDEAEELYSDAVAPAVQIGDIVSQVGVNLPVVRHAFDIAAFISAEFDILSSCLSTLEKIGLTGLNVVNLGVGTFAGTNPAAVVGAVAVESAIYGFTTHYITDKCGHLRVVYAVAGGGKE